MLGCSAWRQHRILGREIDILEIGFVRLSKILRRLPTFLKIINCNILYEVAYYLKVWFLKYGVWNSIILKWQFYSSLYPSDFQEDVIITDQSFEFPRYNYEHYNLREYRYVYGSSILKYETNLTGVSELSLFQRLHARSEIDRENSLLCIIFSKIFNSIPAFPRWDSFIKSLWIRFFRLWRQT